MSEAENHFDEYEHYNYDQEKHIRSGHSGKQRSKKEAAQNTNHHNPGGHERKIVTKLQNMEANQRKKEEKWNFILKVSLGVAGIEFIS